MDTLPCGFYDLKSLYASYRSGSQLTTFVVSYIVKWTYDPSFFSLYRLGLVIHKSFHMTWAPSPSLSLSLSLYIYIGGSKD